MAMRRRSLSLLAAAAAALGAGTATAEAAGFSFVLRPAETPGLKPARATVVGANRAVGAALLPARLPALQGTAHVAHFRRGRETDLWSLALVLRTPRAADQALRGIVHAAQQARLSAARVAIGDRGWLLRRRSGSSPPVVVVWQSNRGLGAILLRAPRGARGLALAYARLADAHLERALTATAWERTLDRIRPNGTVPRKVALDLFALAYGPLPGTKAPAGSAGGTVEGTLATRHILRLWPTLTASQRVAAQRSLGLAGVDLSPRASRTVKRRPRQWPFSPWFRSDYGDPGFQQVPAIQAEADKWVRYFNDRLPDLSLTVVAGTTTSPVKEANADATTVDPEGIFSVFKSTVCRIRVTQAGLREAGSLGREYTIFALAHEVFHCFEADIQRRANLPAFTGKDWLIEGLAEWAALAAYQPSWAVGGSWYAEYLNTCSTKPLFARTYDSLGFFGHVEDSIGDLWSRIPDILAVGHLNEKAYRAAGGNEGVLLDSWASSVYLKPSPYTIEWEARRPIRPPESLKCPTIPIPEGSVAAAPFTLTPYEISDAGDPQRPLLHVAIKGHARLSDGRIDRTDLGDAWFCLRQKCECPPERRDRHRLLRRSSSEPSWQSPAAPMVRAGRSSAAHSRTTASGSRRSRRRREGGRRSVAAAVLPAAAARSPIPT